MVWLLDQTVDTASCWNVELTLGLLQLKEQENRHILDGHNVKLRNNLPRLGW